MLSVAKPKVSAYPTELKTIGDHVRARRLDLGLYQQDVAKRIGVSTDTVTNWEKNRATPTPRTWPDIIEFLGYDPRPLGQTCPRGTVQIYSYIGELTPRTTSSTNVAADI